MKKTSNIIPFPEQKKIQDEAASWIIRLDGGELSTDQEQEFIAWLNKSRLHKKKFFDLCYLWGKYDFFGDLANIIRLDNSSAKITKSSVMRQAIIYSALAVVIIVMGINSYFRPTALEATSENAMSNIRSSAALEQKGQTLENFISRLNNELNTNIVISDDEIKDIRLDDSEISTKDIDKFFYYLRNKHLISVYHDTNNRVYLSQEELRQL